MFFCPIHHTDQYQEVDIDCFVDTITIRICDQCEAQRQVLGTAMNWFYDGNLKFPAEIKKKLKTSFLHYYEEQDILETKDAASYSCLRYFRDKLTRIEIYQYWYCPPNGYRVSIDDRKHHRYWDIKSDIGLPMHLAQDDDWLMETFFTAKYLDKD